MDLRRHLIMKTVIFGPDIIELRSVSCFFFFHSYSVSESEIDVVQQEIKTSVGELEGGVYLCVEHDIFFTLRLSSRAAVNMMDNVSGLGLLGVICCLYHPPPRAEAERERANERD